MLYFRPAVDLDTLQCDVSEDPESPGGNCPPLKVLPFNYSFQYFALAVDTIKLLLGLSFSRGLYLYLQ